MKTSLYNTILPLGQGVSLIYNALSDKYLALKGTLKIEGGRLEDAVEDPELRSQLQEIGALIDDEVDEPQQVRDMILKHDHASDAFQLHVNPTVDCNFRCWYCYEDHHAGSRMEAPTVKAVEALMQHKVEENADLKIFSLSFFGGEPLMGFANVVEPLVLALKRICADKNISTSVHFTTNGYLINERMLSFFAEHPASFQITFDGHRELHDKVRCTLSGEGSYDRILHNISELAKRKCQVLVRINFTSDNIHSIPAIIEDFKSLPEDEKEMIRFDLQRVWQDLPREIEEQTTADIAGYQKELKAAGYGVSIYKSHDMVRSSCYGDKRNYMLVNYDGGIFLCTARDFDDKHRAGTLQSNGEVKWRDNAHECRLAAKFSKPVCHTCRIAPICGGGCCTQALEHPDPNTCIYGYTEEQMDEMVATRFEQLYMVQQADKMK